MQLTLSVYFEKNDGFIDSQNSLTSLFANHTVTDNIKNFSMSFDGCGTNHPYRSSLDFGFLFTYGLSNQVNSVVNKVKELLQDPSNILRVNGYGFSRGGAAVLLLAKLLNQLPSNLLNRLEINIAALEPVPGNLIPQVKADIIQHTLSSKIWDLSKCKINSMLLIYTNELLPTSSNFGLNVINKAFAPILPNYPTQCAATVDIIYGCHETAQSLNFSEDEIFFGNASSFINFCRFKNFLEVSGTKFNLTEHHYFLQNQTLTETRNTVKKLYNTMLSQLKEDYDQKTTREMHKGNQIETSISEDTQYINSHHQQLCMEEDDYSSSNQIAFTLKEEKPQASPCLLS